MKMKINFNNPQVFEELEDKAIDGQLDYQDFPAIEYKYFSKLSKLGYNNRHNGWDVNICTSMQEQYRKDYVALIFLLMVIFLLSMFLICFMQRLNLLHWIYPLMILNNL